MAWALRGPWAARSDTACIHRTEHNGRGRLQTQQFRSSPCFKNFTVDLPAHLFHLLKRQRLVRFHRAERGKDVQQAADVSHLDVENIFFQYSNNLKAKKKMRISNTFLRLTKP